MKQEHKIFFEKLKGKLDFKELPLKLREFDQGLQISTHDQIGLTFDCQVDVETDRLDLYFYHRTTSWNFDGERSDLHDVISVIFCVFLKVNFDISCSIHDVPHPAIETEAEIYARYIIPQQIESDYFSFDTKSIEKISALIIGISIFEFFFWRAAGCPCDECRLELKPPYDYSYEVDEVWLKVINKTLKSRSKKICITSRYLPTWEYYKNYSTDVTIVRSGNLCRLVNKQVKDGNKNDIVVGITGELSISKNCSNYVSLKLKSTIHEALLKIDNNVENTTTIQLENIVVLVGKEHLIFKERLGGILQFNEEKEKIRTRHLYENKLLFPVTNLVWQKKIDPLAFENMIKDLLEREPEMIWVRKVSHTNQADGGRDMIAELRVHSTNESQNLENDKAPFINKKIIVQCKTSNKGIGKAQVQDIRDTIENHNYDGYFLAVSTYVKTSLTDFLDRLRTSNKFWINWWTSDEIEKRLIVHQDILLKYPTVITKNK